MIDVLLIQGAGGGVHDGWDLRLVESLRRELGPGYELRDPRMPDAVPILMFHGEADDVVPVEHVERYRELLPRAVIRRLAGRDHQLNDDLSEVASAIRALSPASGPAFP